MPYHHHSVVNSLGVKDLEGQKERTLNFKLKDLTSTTVSALY